MSSKPVILEVEDVKVHFRVPGKGGLFPKPRVLRAVDGVSFQVRAGETLGVVGESGCGKSTLGRAILRLLPLAGGRVSWLGQDLAALDPAALRAVRKDLQVIFQDPLASLDPRMPVGEIIAEPLRTHCPELPDDEIRSRVKAMMAKMGLMPEHINRYPHEFSGGQCQRIGIARAMIAEPRLIVCDEAVSALDVSVQAQIVNLLMSIQREFGVGLIFISHNLAVVRHISHRILVLYLGRVMEVADRDVLYRHPRHPYTQALISAVPIPDPEVERDKPHLLLSGDLPSPLDPHPGCPFSSRCPHAIERCRSEVPALETVAEGHRIACHRWREVPEPVFA